MRVLVADDEQDVQDYLKRMVTVLGHEVVGCAGDGRQLIALAQKTHPDLIITDVRMPELSGDEAMRQIAQTLPIPSILISAHLANYVASDPNQIFLSKPLTRNDLAGAIDRATTGNGLANAANPVAEERKGVSHD